MIQVIAGTKVRKKTIVNILPHSWNGNKEKHRGKWVKSHSSAVEYNNKIIEALEPVEKLIHSGKPFDIDQVFSQGAKTAYTFWELADLYLRSLSSGWSARTYGSIIGKFKDAVQDDKLTLKDINHLHLRKFNAYLEGRGNGENTKRTNLKVLRYVSSFAEKSKIEPKNPALHEDTLPSGDAKHKSKLTEAEFKRIEGLELPSTVLGETRDLFVLSVYCRGMRIGDMIQLKQEYFREGRLVYEMNKSKKSHDIKLNPKALAIVQRYADGNQYLFSYYTFKPDPAKDKYTNLLAEADFVKTVTARINSNLKRIANKAGITKNLSTHIGRHTFAKMAIDKIKDTNVTMDLLGHGSIKIHQAYVREISKSDLLDEAADSIFG